MSQLKCKVLQVRTTHGGMVIAHVQAGQFFGDVPADDHVKEGDGILDFRLRKRQGRLEVALKVFATDTDIQRYQSSAIAKVGG